MEINERVNNKHRIYNDIYTKRSNQKETTYAASIKGFQTSKSLYHSSYILQFHPTANQSQTRTQNVV